MNKLMQTQTRYMVRRTVRTLCAPVALAASLMLGACASLQPTRSGFLSDYDELHPSASSPHAGVFRKPGLDTGHYSAFVLEPVAFQPARALKTLDRSTIEALTADYQEKLRTAFARHLLQTGSRGPGVLVVRAAITDVQQANPYVNAVTMAAVFVPVTAGGASTEAEVIDSVSGERLAALQEATNGGRAFLGGPIGYLSKYGHARRAFARQADELAEDLFGRGSHAGLQSSDLGTLGHKGVVRDSASAGDTGIAE